MQILNQSLASLGRWSHHTAIAILLCVSLVQSQATIYTVSSGAYTAGYDTSQNGFTTWSGSGVNQLALQSLYYSVNGGPVSLLTGAIVNTGSSGFSSKYITATFSIPNGDIADTLTINGNTLSESIQFDNLGASGLNVSIFQYSDFVLGVLARREARLSILHRLRVGDLPRLIRRAEDWRSLGTGMFHPALRWYRPIPAGLRLALSLGWVATLTILLWLPSILMRSLAMNFRGACCRATC